MLIGLHGKARSGKDTVFRMIQQDFGGSGIKVVRDAFADRLKISAARALGFDGAAEECIAFCNDIKTRGVLTAEYGSDGDFISITGREFLQKYGTEAHREVFGYDFWVDAVLPNWQDDDYGREDGLTANDILVITDVRFVNEAERIVDCGGVVWEITRPAAEVGDSHASEQRLPSEFINYTIENLGSLDALQAKVNLGVWSALSQQVAS